MTVTDAVHDIAFAPNLGRSFHVLAIATKDVRIFKLVPMRCLIFSVFLLIRHIVNIDQNSFGGHALYITYLISVQHISYILFRLVTDTLV